MPRATLIARMSRKFWKVFGTVAALVVVLGLLFVVAFIFNPFEGSIADIRELVPRQSDYFVRKTDLREDFTEFPEPVFWNDFAASASWRDLRNGPAYVGLQRDAKIEEAVAGLRQVSDQIRQATGGSASLLGDALGSELVLAGKFGKTAADPGAYCAYLRISWKVRFAWGLLEWESVRQNLATQGIPIERREDGTFAIRSGSPDQVLIARFLDCLLVSNNEEFLNESIQYAKGFAETESFRGTYQYRDGIEAPLREWESEVGIAANAVEFYLRPDQLFARTTWDDGWPDPRHPDDMNQRVLATFLSLSGWTFLTGSAIFEGGGGFGDPDSLTLLSRIELNSNMHSPFQREFFRAEAQDRSEWLQPFLTMVPERACAAAAMRMPACDFLQEMYQAVAPELRRELDQLIARTGKFQSVSNLIDSLRTALQSRTGFVFHQKRSLGDHPDGRPIESFEPTPAPHVAWVFWIDPRNRTPLEELYKFLSDYREILGFTAAYDLPILGAGGGDAAREFINPNIPGTGEIAILLYGNFFVVSNSGPLVRDMALARLKGTNVLALRDYEVFDREIASQLNGFVYLQGERLAEVAQDYLDALDSGDSMPDPEWAMGARPTVEREVLRREFPSSRAVGSLRRDERERFDQLVASEMGRRWAAEKDRYVAADRQSYRQVQALTRMFSSAFLQVELEPQFMDLKSRILFRFR